MVVRFCQLLYVLPVLYLCIAQRVMWFKLVFLSLSFFQLGLGAAQECEGFVGVLEMALGHLKKEPDSGIVLCSIVYGCTEAGCGYGQWK